MAASHQDREDLKRMYPGPKWDQKVDKMSDGQVLTILKRIRTNK